MTLTKEMLNSTEEHWAISSIPADEKARAFEVSNIRNIQAAVGDQIQITFEHFGYDSELIEKVATAYEIAAIEDLDSLIYISSNLDSVAARHRAQAYAYRAFELLRSIDTPNEHQGWIYHTLHLGSLAYCSDRSVDMQRWVNENFSKTSFPDKSPWNLRVLASIHECWMRMYRKDGWSDFNEIPALIVSLREQQKEHEDTYLSAFQALAEKKQGAYTLIALYNLAKATEMLSIYMLQGENKNIDQLLDQHFEASRKAAIAAHDHPLEVIIRWLHVAARRMANSSLWWAVVNAPKPMIDFAEVLTRQRGMFEMLPPQRVAIREQGLLNMSHRAVVVDMPTSGGKTAIAQFRMLQALDQFKEKNGWVAYVAPTRALVSQLARRLRRDFSPLGIKVEQLTGAVEIDSFEEDVLKRSDDKAFNILISTPEKLHIVIRNKKIKRPLALIVMDEAHNMEDKERGLRIELLLATIKSDCADSNFLLLMPFVPNANELADWLAPESGKSISLSTSAWKPNDRIIGAFSVNKNTTARGGWDLSYETLLTSPGTLQLAGSHKVGGFKPFNIPYTEATTQYKSTAAIASIMSTRGTSIAVAQKIRECWSMARLISESLESSDPIPEDVSLVQRYLKDEVGADFELIDMLGKGIGVHHAGLSDEARSLIEWLAEEGHLRILCATSTINQGLNFPVSSVFLSSLAVPYGKMTPRAFWNLAGRAGRIGHESVGVVGISAGRDINEVKKFVSEATGNLISRLESMLEDLLEQGSISDLSAIIYTDQWSDFRSYIAHLWVEKQSLDAVLAETEQILRNTFGYSHLRTSTDKKKSAMADALLTVTKEYARSLEGKSAQTILADATGFSPEGVSKALSEISKLEDKISIGTFTAESLFGSGGRAALSGLIGVMMSVPQVGKSLNDIVGEGRTSDRLAEIASAWVNGSSIKDIAQSFFSTTRSADTNSITLACRAIYREIANSMTWGLSAMSKLAGIDYELLTEEERRKINNLPAMIYHGVRTDNAILMRMNSVPRSVSESLGIYFQQTQEPALSANVSTVRDFIKGLSAEEWGRCLPKDSNMTGHDYKTLWNRLSGMSD